MLERPAGRVACEPGPAESGKRLKDQLFSDTTLVSAGRRRAPGPPLHHGRDRHAHLAGAFAPAHRAVDAREPRHAAHRGDHRRHPLHHPEDRRRRVRGEEPADDLLGHRRDRGRDHRQGHLRICGRRHRRLSRPPLHRRSPHPDVRQARQRRSLLHPDRAFGTAAVGLPQRRQSDPADGEPLHRHARRELPQGHHSRRHHVLHGCAFCIHDPALHADRLVSARRASAARCGNRPPSRCRRPATCRR